MKGLGFGLEKWVRLTNMGSSSDWNLIKLASVRFQICLVAISQSQEDDGYFCYKKCEESCKNCWCHEFCNRIIRASPM